MKFLDGFFASYDELTNEYKPERDNPPSHQDFGIHRYVNPDKMYLCCHTYKTINFSLQDQ